MSSNASQARAASSFARNMKSCARPRCELRRRRVENGADSICRQSASRARNQAVAKTAYQRPSDRRKWSERPSDRRKWSER
eukprot:1177578-Prorocentrum_minimum.AAC.5